MTARQTIWLYLTLTMLMGVLSVALPSEPARTMDAFWLILSVAVPYVWFYLDAAERSFARTPRWSTGIILMAPVTVPLYLLKSRGPGQRLKAIAKAFGVFCLSILLPAVGAALYELPATGL